MVALFVSGVFEEEVRSAGFYLRLKDLEPKFLSGDGFDGFAFLFVFFVESFKIFAMCVCQAWC